MKKTRCQIILEFSDRELANQMWAKLTEKPIGYSVETVKVSEDLYPIARVCFDSTTRRYTYRLSDELAKRIEEDPAQLSRDWPTQYGLTPGTSEPIQWLTMAEVNKLWPFDKITVVRR